jgi:hypothetical protein
MVESYGVKVPTFQGNRFRVSRERFAFQSLRKMR